MSAPQCSTQVRLQGEGLPDERRNSLFFCHKGKTNGILRGCKITRFCSHCYEITPGIFVFAFHTRLTGAQRHLLGKNLEWSLQKESRLKKCSDCIGRDMSREVDGGRRKGG